MKKKINLNKIYLENCLIGMKKIEANSIDMVLTDPPYFIDGLDNKWNILKNEKKKKFSKTITNLPAGMKFDKKQGEALQKFYYKVSLEVYRILKPGGFYISFSQGRLYHRTAVAVEDAGFEIRDMFSWGRNTQPKAFSLNHFAKNETKKLQKELTKWKTPMLASLFEPAVFAQKPKNGTFIENWKKWNKGLINSTTSFNNIKIPNYIFYNKTKTDKFEHMTVKPLAIIEYLIRLGTSKGEIVLDPFIGSGTTAVASLNNERNFIGFEINRKFIKIANQRINNVKKTSKNTRRV